MGKKIEIDTIDNVTNNEKGGINLGVLIIFLVVVFLSLMAIRHVQNLTAHNRIINQNLTDKNDGLYEDDVATGLSERELFTSKYYFKGKNPNNYLMISSACFRIINITQNNYLKIIYEGKSIDKNNCENIEKFNPKLTYNESQLNSWNSSNIDSLFNEWISNNKIDDITIDFTSNDSIISTADWYIGGVKFSGNKLLDNIVEERSEVINSKIGLITVTEYLKAGCQKSVYDAIESCGENNYLYNEKNNWTLTKTLGGNQHVWAIENGMTSSILADNQNYSFNPVLVLKSGLKLKGSGTAKSPYMVIK